MSIQPQVRPKFDPGRIVATPGALEAIEASGQSPEVFLAAHLDGYWGGDLCETEAERFINYYSCPDDGTEWTCAGDSMHNDRCPKCDAEIEPYSSEEIGDEGEVVDEISHVGDVGAFLIERRAQFPDAREVGAGGAG